MARGDPNVPWWLDTKEDLHQMEGIPGIQKGPSKASHTIGKAYDGTVSDLGRHQHPLQGSFRVHHLANTLRTKDKRKRKGKKKVPDGT